MKTTRALYAEKLAREGVLAAGEAKAIWDGFNQTLEDAYKAAQSYKPNKADWLEGHWSGLNQPGDDDEWIEDDTAVPPDTLRKIGAALSRVPEDFDLNSEDRSPARSQEGR